MASVLSVSLWMHLSGVPPLYPSVRLISLSVFHILSSNHLSIHFSTHLTIHPFVSLSLIHPPSIHRSIWNVSVYSSVFLSNHWSLFRPPINPLSRLHLSVHSSLLQACHRRSSVYPHLSTHLAIRPSIRPSAIYQSSRPNIHQYPSSVI